MLLIIFVVIIVIFSLGVLTGAIFTLYISDSLNEVKTLQIEARQLRNRLMSTENELRDMDKKNKSGEWWKDGETNPLGDCY
jgi:regulator of replication initiation timing